MAKVTKAQVDQALRNQVFEFLFEEGAAEMAGATFVKVNDRQYGIILTDLNGEERYVRLGAVVAELREEITAQELMALEIEEYEMKQAAKAEKAKAKAEKIAKDKAKREAAKAKEEGE